MSIKLFFPILLLAGCTDLNEVPDTDLEESAESDQGVGLAAIGDSFVVSNPGTVEKVYQQSPWVVVGIYKFTEGSRNGVRVKVVNELNRALHLDLTSFGVSCQSTSLNGPIGYFTVPAHSTGATVYTASRVFCPNGEKVTGSSAGGWLEN
jgi:hypothetical protein